MPCPTGRGSCRVWFSGCDVRVLKVKEINMCIHGYKVLKVYRVLKVNYIIYYIYRVHEFRYFWIQTLPGKWTSLMGPDSQVHGSHFQYSDSYFTGPDLTHYQAYFYISHSHDISTSPSEKKERKYAYHSCVGQQFYLTFLTSLNVVFFTVVQEYLTFWNE